MSLQSSAVADCLKTPIHNWFQIIGIFKIVIWDYIYSLSVCPIYTINYDNSYFSYLNFMDIS